MYAQDFAASIGVWTLMLRVWGTAGVPVGASDAFLFENLLRHLLVQAANQDYCPPQVQPRTTLVVRAP